MNLLLRILLDERGSWGYVAVAVASTAASYLGSKKRGKPDSVGDYDWTRTGEIKDKLSQSLLDRQANPTQYKYNPAFDIQQPAVESAAEKNILGYFDNPNKNVQDYSEATKKYSDAAKASREQSSQNEITKAKDMYNRLGLVSSTPGLTAVGDINESQRVANDLFDSELMYKNLDRQLSAQGLDVSQLNSMLGQAGNMSNTQRQGQEYSQQATMDDLNRQEVERNNTIQAMMTYLGIGTSSPLQQYQSRLFQWQQPNGWDWASTALKSGASAYAGG